MSIIADVLNSMPATRAFCIAKRGDLALFALTSSCTMLAGGTTRETTYHLRRVTNITARGLVAGYARRDADGNEFNQKPRAGITYPCSIVPAAKLIDAGKCFAILGACEFTSPESAKEALQPFRKA